MKKIALLLLSAAAVTALAIGCGDETSGTTSTSTSTTTSSSGSTTGGGGGEGPGLGDMPAKYGAQLDRFGRPAINTALNSTFVADDAAKGAAKDAWNADSDAANWGKTHAGEVAKNLAILDSLDTVCGNQFAASKTLDANRYMTLAGVLADDRQWLNTGTSTCSVYLGVEANATGLIPNSDCGGRHLDYDVVDVSYSALAIGDVKGVTDGIAVPDGAKGKTFPYLAAPK